MSKSIEELVGEDYYSVSDSLDGTKYGFTALARHIRMVLGDNQWNEPIWRVRVFPDGKIVELDKFEEYLLRPVREGFGLESLHALKSGLLGIGREGDEAIAALKKEIPDWDHKVKVSQAEQRDKDIDPQPTLSEAMKGNTNAKKDKDENSGSLTTAVSKQERGAEYLTARLKRDAPEIAARLAKGEFKSVRAAAIEAGIIKPPSNLDQAKRYWSRLNDDERGEFLSWISNEV